MFLAVVLDSICDPAGGRDTAVRGMGASASELMAQYCDGDVAAFRELYAMTASRLLGYLVCLVRDRATAEELLQQTFIKLHEARSVYVRGADPIPWMYTIAHRTCLDEIRRRKRARVTVAKDDRGLPEPVADVSGAPPDEAAAETERTIAAVLEALDELPENQRLALVLTKIQGRSVVEAAAILGTTPGAVKLRAHRAYVTLRERMRAWEEEQ